MGRPIFTDPNAFLNNINSSLFVNVTLPSSTQTEQGSTLPHYGNQPPQQPQQTPLPQYPPQPQQPPQYIPQYADNMPHPPYGYYPPTPYQQPPMGWQGGYHPAAPVQQLQGPYGFPQQQGQAYIYPPATSTSSSYHNTRGAEPPSPPFTPLFSQSAIPSFCTICNKEFNSEFQSKEHFGGKVHQKKVLQHNRNPGAAAAYNALQKPMLFTRAQQ